MLSLLPLAFTFRRGYQRFLSALYLTVNSLALILNLGDAVYYRFTFKRTTSSVFAEFGNENPLHFLRFFVDYWGVTLTGLALILLLVVVDRCLPRPTQPPRTRLISYRLAGSLALIVTVALSVIGMRGGSAGTTRPITLSNAAIYIEQPQQRALVLNTPFCLIRTLGKEALPEYRYFSEAPSIVLGGRRARGASAGAMWCSSSGRASPVSGSGGSIGISQATVATRPSSIA